MTQPSLPWWQEFALHLDQIWHAALFIVDNVCPEAILHVMSPVVSGAFFGFWGNLRGAFSRDNGMVGHMILARCGHLVSYLAMVSRPVLAETS